MNPALLQKGSNSFRTDSEIKDHEGMDLEEISNLAVWSFTYLEIYKPNGSYYVR